MRFPRVNRLRWDKPPGEADRLETLERMLAKIEAERDRIAALIAAQAAQGSGTYVGPGGGNGYLSMPVAGSVTSPYGWRTHPIWGYRSLHDGIDFGASCGTPVRAAAPGKVLSTYYRAIPEWFAGFATTTARPTG